MKNVKFCLLAFGVIILSAKLSGSEASPQTEPRPPEYKPAVLHFLETIWKIVLSPFTLFFSACDYATELGERSGAFLQRWYYAHVAPTTPPPTAAPETNEIPPFVKSTHLQGSTEEKKESVLHRINTWIKSKAEAFKRPRNTDSLTLANTTDWQYPSDLSEESGQDTLGNGLTWFLSSKKLNIDAGKVENQTEAKDLDNLLTKNETRHRSKIFASAGRGFGKARDAVVEKAHKLGEKGRHAYDWVLWKLLARHSTLPTFFGKVVNSTAKTWLKGTKNPDPTETNSTIPSSFFCDDVPSPICAVDDNRGFTIFLNPCKLSEYNYKHQTNFTIYSTDVCMGLFINYPEKFFQSKKE